MSNATAEIRARIEALQEELRTIAPHPHNAERIASRKRGVQILQDQLERVERVHQRFLEGRAELLARCDRFGSMMPDAR
jgi:hypothetical protein